MTAGPLSELSTSQVSAFSIARMPRYAESLSRPSGIGGGVIGAAWQHEIVNQYTKEFIRGLIHSAGCRSMNRVRRPLKDGDRWYEYPRYTFCNESPDIRRLFTDALDMIEIPWRQMNRKVISVARREAMARLDVFAGPKY